MRSSGHGKPGTLAPSPRPDNACAGPASFVPFADVTALFSDTVRRVTLVACAGACVAVLTARAQDAPPPRFVETPSTSIGAASDVTAVDRPGDAGGALRVSWTLPDPASVDSVQVFRMTGAGTELATTLIGPASEYDDAAAGEGPVRYVVELFSGPISARSTPSTAITARPNWFNTTRTNQLIILTILVGAIGFFTAWAARGRQLYIRKIAGLEAIDEAVGRATEMGRAVLFIPGINDLDDVQTLAGLNILSQIASKVAQYETTLDVPVARSLVMSTGRESVREAYLAAGRPDLYNEDMVHYVTDEQFGYVAAVDGIMVRQKPAACFYLGAFFAESLVLAETGNSIGAIQVAGTAMPTQLPFFVAACDYTLIGEELFAASAYLSGDQQTIGSLRGQDIGKLVAMTAIVVGVLAVLFRIEPVSAGVHWLFKVN